MDGRNEFFPRATKTLQAIALDHKQMMVGRRDKDLRWNEPVAGVSLGDLQMRAAFQNLSQQTFVIGRNVHHDGNGRRKILRQTAQNDGQSLQAAHRRSHGDDGERMTDRHHGEFLKRTLGRRLTGVPIKSFLSCDRDNCFRRLSHRRLPANPRLPQTFFDLAVLPKDLNTFSSFVTLPLVFSK